MKYKTLVVILSLLLASTVLIGGTRTLSAQNRSGEKQRVATSFYPIYIAALNLTEGIDDVEVINLTEGQTGCLHDFTLRPQDMVTLEGSAALLINGGGMETFLDAVDGAYPQLPVIDSSTGFSEAEADHDDETETDHDHEHGANAHYWLSMAHYKMQVENLCQGLIEVWPQYKTVLEANAAAYLTKITALQEAYETRLAPYADTGIVILNEAFAYLAMDCDLHVAASVHMEKDTALSAAEIAEIVDLIEHSGVGILLAESQYSAQLAQTVERETGVYTCTLDAATGGAKTADAYLNIMYQNLDLLEQALEARK